MPQKILVTGASGFIAGHCVLDLLKHGYEVRGTVRDLGKVSALKSMFAKYTDKVDALEFAQVDLLSPEGWTEAAHGCDGIFHLASPVPRKQPSDPLEVIAPAKEGALHALRAAKQVGINRVVLTSSVAAVMYGHKGKNLTFTEKDWTNLNAKGLTPYFQSKTMAEQAAWDFVADTDIKLSTILPGLVLGPALDRDYGTSLSAIAELAKGRYPLLPKVGFEVVDVRDVATLHRLAYENKEAEGRRFLCTTGFVWLKQVAEAVKMEVPDAKVPSVEMPNLLFDALSLFMKDLEMIKGEAGKTKVADNSAAKSLGWEPRSPVEAIVSGARSLKQLGVF